MNDYLKKIAKSLEEGQPNSEITEHHYDVLHGADMVEAKKAAEKLEEKEYDNDLKEFIDGNEL